MAHSILHVSPTYYSEASVIGGGEKYIVYMSRAAKAAATARNTELHDSVLAFGAETGIFQLSHGVTCEVIHGRPWDPYSISITELTARIDKAEVIVVHQCLSAFGLFVASHARLANKRVIGIDEGGGEHGLVHHTPEIGRIFTLFHAYSQFCANSFQDLDGRVEVVLGPVDSAYYIPDGTKTRDPALVLAVGRILPHKGFDRIIRVLPAARRLIIAGTNYDQEYFDYLGALPNIGRVEIRQHLSDAEILSLMQTAGVFVHASTHIDYRGRYYAKPELLGLAPLEALSSGTPALVSSAGSLPELASIKGCLEFQDDGELAALLEMPPDFNGMIPSPSEIHNDVEKKYGLQVFGKRFLDAVLAH